MEAADVLLAKAQEYELRAVACAERAPLRPGEDVAATGFTVVAIVLREVAEALEEAA